MQLFTRSVALAGSFPEVMAYATDIRSHVADKIGREVALWSSLFGAPFGTMTFSSRVEGLADLQSIGAALVSDPEYHAKLAVGRAYATRAPEDQLFTPLYGELGDAPPVGAVAVVTSAAIANGKYTEALTWSVEIAKYVEGVTGIPTLFGLDEYGTFGQVAWIGVAPDAAASDAAAAKLNADAGYLDRVGEGSTLFAQGSGFRSLVSRIA